MAGRVLLVDDYDDILATLRELFELEGYQVAVASNGADALTHLECQAVLPDAVVFDLAMPRADGVAFARAVRADPRFANVRLVAMTGVHPMAQPSTLADAMLQKPFSFAQILRAVAGEDAARSAPADPWFGGG